MRQRHILTVIQILQFHTTASRLNEKGVDILTIKEILDHSDLKTTQQYTHTPRKNILDAVNILEEY